MAFGNITFHSPWWFTLLLVFVILAVFLRKVRIQDTVIANFSKTIAWWRVWQLVVYRVAFWGAFIIVTLLLSGPHISHTTKEKTYEGVDIMLVMDVSASMLAQDFSPNRMEAAKDIISSFLDRSRGNRIGTIVFSGKPFLFAPLTHDTDFLTQQIRSVSTESIRQDSIASGGTAVGDALLLASKHLLDARKDRDQVVILVTDGQSNEGVNPRDAAQYLKQNNLLVYAVGIGDPEGDFYEISSSGLKQQAHLQLDEKMLGLIASGTSGKVFLASDNEALGKVFDELEGRVSSKISEKNISQDVSYTKPFLLILISCLGVLLILQFVYPRLRPI